MFEPPSPELQRLLLETGLCRPRDLRTCRSLVRRLSIDLPTFDSLWLDALLQIRRLTPFQARLLSSRQPERIRIGQLILIDRLGGHPRSETFSARYHDARKTTFALKRFSRATSQQTRERVQELIDRLGAASHASVIGPDRCEQSADETILVSRLASGPQLAELLVRRGRFPADVVWEIGRQLLSALEVLHRAEVWHGDIRLTNVRLANDGRAVLVDAGLRFALEPELTIHSGLSAEQVDTIAPELIGVGCRPHAGSDLYALGCLLWQLLAGRPPFPGADPLTKIAAHQTRTIDDVRRWAPETPAPLARGIAWLTQRDPQARPNSAMELLERWKPPRNSGCRRVARFLTSYASPHVDRSARAFAWAGAAAALLALSGLAVSLSHAGARAAILSIAQSVQAQATRSSPETRPERQQPVPTALEQRGFPVPDERGVIELPDAGPWHAGTVSTAGPLTIRAKPGVEAVILVDDRPLELTAQSVRIEGVHVGSASPGSSATCLITITAAKLDVRRCTFRTSAGPEQSPSPTALAWRAPPGTGAGCAVHDCVFLGSGPALHMGSAIGVQIENCLHIGRGPLITLTAVPPTGDEVVIALRNVTSRVAGPLFRWRIRGTAAKPGSIRIEPTQCVFSLLPAVPLVDLAADSRSDGVIDSINILGDGTLVRMDAEAAWVSPVDGTREPLPAERSIELEGLQAEEIRFGGKSPLVPSDSQITGREMPIPGIDPQRLPAIPHP